MLAAYCFAVVQSIKIAIAPANDQLLRQDGLGATVIITIERHHAALGYAVRPQLLLWLGIVFLICNLVFDVTVIPGQSGHHDVINRRHVLLAKNEVFLVYVEANRWFLIEIKYVFEIVDHVGSGTNNREVLQQSHWIEVDSRLVLLDFGRNDDAADDESVMMQDVLDFDCWLSIPQLPVKSANVLYLRRFQEGQPRRG